MDPQQDSPSWLNIENLSVHRGGSEILRGIDLQISHGELIAIVGANGCGKSTLLAALLGQVEASSGTIKIDGESRSRLSHQQCAATFAWLPQESPTPEPLLVEEVVAAARYHLDEPRPDALEQSRKALQESGAGDLSQRWWNELSGGERQRVELATLKAQEARAWLLDEPANHLDPVWRTRLLDELQQQVLSGATVIVVLHDIHLLEEFRQVKPRVVALAEGQVVYDGADPRELGEDWQSRIWNGETPAVKTAGIISGGRKPWRSPGLLLWGLVTVLIGLASASLLGSAEYRLATSVRRIRSSAPIAAATSAERVSLSPNRNSTDDTVSFSLMIGRTPHSRS